MSEQLANRLWMAAAKAVSAQKHSLRSDQAVAAEAAAGEALAWMAERLADPGLRAAVETRIDDESDYSYGAYGTPDAATAALEAIAEALGLPATTEDAE